MSESFDPVWYQCYLCQPHELELREEKFDSVNKKVHGVDVDEWVVLDETGLYFDGHLPAVLKLGFVELGQAGCAEGLLHKITEKLVWITA